MGFVRYRLVSFALLLVVALLVTGCGSLGLDAPDAQATLQAEETALALEATRIPGELSALSTQVAVTAVAAETYVARMDGINRQMVATLRAVMPPTAQVIQGRDGAALPGGAGSVDSMDVQGTPASGVVTFTAFQTASAVNSADGCVQTPSSLFGVNDTIIYATARALNMRAGTEMTAEWSFGGQVVYTFSFVVDVDDPDYCLWFSITPQDVTFTPGDWTVSMLANGAPIASAVSFRIDEAM
jgi:hypothetical protein